MDEKFFIVKKHVPGRGLVEFKILKEKVEQAMESLRNVNVKLGVYGERKFPCLIVPEFGVGIKSWGKIDLLKNYFGYRVFNDFTPVGFVQTN